MKNTDFDLIVIGGGGAGITAAKFAAGLGKKVALADKKKFGGECTWSGCIPSKALLQAAKAAHTSGTLELYGLTRKKKEALSAKSALESIRKIISLVYLGENSPSMEKLGITAMENAVVSFVDPHTVLIDGKRITSKKFLIATGSSPFIPPVEGLDKIPFFTNETVFHMTRVPASMIVMGGGPIGVELASAFNRLGVKTGIIDLAPGILPREDRELSALLEKILEGEGITIVTGAKLLRADGGKKIRFHYEKEGQKKILSAEALLVAAGRKANVHGLDLEKAGVAYDAKGIKTDRLMETSSRGIYAAGDVAGPYQFSHMAEYQAIIAVNNAFIPLKRKVRYDHVPWCTFTDPELARSGMTETEAKKKYGDRLKVYRVGYRDIDRGITDRKETGIAKILCDRRGKIVGVHILGERAGEVMQELHLAKSLGVPLYRLDSVIHAYPLYSDIIKRAARDAYLDRIQGNLMVKLIKKIRNMLND